ncbi:MAG: hypothetical protein Q9195_006412 [Heterodermia aff. obscurata]
MPGKCFSKGQLERIIISQAFISIISDFFLSIFPILILRHVQISLRNKIGLCLLMGLGVITAALSIVRTVLNGQNQAPDPTWQSIPNWYWRCWEVFFGMAAATIPTLRPGYVWAMGRLRDGFTKLNSGKAGEGKWTPPRPSALPTDEKTVTAWSGDEGLQMQSFRADVERYPLHAT